MRIRLLDCTLRDGGYYNDWDFAPDLVDDYLNAMAASGVDVVEIGFRFHSADRYLGPYAFSPEEVLKGLNLPQGTTVAIMINEADFPNPEGAVCETINANFRPCSDSRLDMVRVAVNRERLKNAAYLVEQLKRLGYRVCLNVMQITAASDQELKEISRIADTASPDVLYFADSTGSMQPRDVERVITGLRCHWSGSLGIHAHDNMQMALVNCQTAAAAGVEWVDGTVLGMGRGPGNARTEHLLMAFDGQRSTQGDISPLLECIRDWFEPLQDRYRWGANPYYYLAGKHGIHPTYIQTMLADSRYGTDDILATIEHLRDRQANRYSNANLERAGNFYGAVPQGTWSPADLIQGREVLILGSGPGCVQHRRAIERFIRTRRPVVIALNVCSPIDHKLIDLHAACHPIRLLRDAPHYTRLRGTLVTPFSTLPSEVQRSLGQVDCNDFGLGLGDNGFEFGKASAVLPRPMAAAYALAIANSGRAGYIYMAGFDGYGPEDPRNAEMNGLLETYRSAVDVIELAAITPTRYELPETSIYALL